MKGLCHPSGLRNSLSDPAGGACKPTARIGAALEKGQRKLGGDYDLEFQTGREILARFSVGVRLRSAHLRHAENGSVGRGDSRADHDYGRENGPGISLSCRWCQQQRKRNLRETEPGFQFKVVLRGPKRAVY